MSYDPTEAIRKIMVSDINGGRVKPEGPTWDIEALKRDFDVHGFLAPFIHVTRRADGVRGTLMFRHNPRIYFDFQPE